MKITVDAFSFSREMSSSKLDKKLASYLAAGGLVGACMATEAKAVIVADTSVHPFGINGAVPIDFNSDGQTDFKIYQNRVNLNGNNLDFLQIDKNDINGPSNPLPFDPGPACCFQATPFSDGTTARNNANDSAYVVNPNVDHPNGLGSYPAALTLGTPIGPSSLFDWQEGNNFNNTGKWIRANRLIDEDHGQIDEVLGGQPASGIQLPYSGPNFTGLSSSDVRYLGVKMNLNNTGAINYGWIGIQITNEADATGNVVGWAYQTTPGQAITAGVVPEPSSAILGAVGGAFLTGGLLVRRLFSYFKG
jgi:hypothetical protein